jgi:hypothetical protein
MFIGMLCYRSAMFTGMFIGMFIGLLSSPLISLRLIPSP